MSEKFSYLDIDEIAEVKIKLPKPAWERIKEIAVEEHRPAAAQLRIIVAEYLQKRDKEDGR